MEAVKEKTELKPNIDWEEETSENLQEAILHILATDNVFTKRLQYSQLSRIAIDLEIFITILYRKLYRETQALLNTLARMSSYENISRDVFVEGFRISKILQYEDASEEQLRSREEAMRLKYEEIDK